MPPHRETLVSIAGRVVGRAIRRSIAEVEAIQITDPAWERPDRRLGIFRRRGQAERAIRQAAQASP